MSKLANKSLSIANVKISEENGIFSISGAAGKVCVKKINGVEYQIKDGVMSVKTDNKANAGTAIRVLESAISGAQKPFEEKIRMYGADVKCVIEGDTIKFRVGYTHDVFVQIPSGIKVTSSVIGQEIVLNIFGICKRILGEFINEICSVRKYNVYGHFGIMHVSPKKYYISKKSRRK